MKNLKIVITALTLMFVLALPAITGQAQSLLCSPGEVHAPPCEATQLTSDDPAPGQMNTLPEPNAVTEYLVTDAAIDFVKSALSLF
jgi:hypothetical protein